MAHGGEEIGYFGTKREAEAHARWSARILQKRKIFSLAIKAKEALSVLTAEMNPAAKEAGELLEKLEK
ncbi:MAG TPA: hypothetical protein VKS79_21055 [Gemmataceae bacterium]|nr:hypothetical protein [Gemmataceae bacterium]